MPLPNTGAKGGEGRGTSIKTGEGNGQRRLKESTKPSVLALEAKRDPNNFETLKKCWNHKFADPNKVSTQVSHWDLLTITQDLCMTFFIPHWANDCKQKKNLYEHIMPLRRAGLICVSDVI